MFALDRLCGSLCEPIRSSLGVQVVEVRRPGYPKPARHSTMGDSAAATEPPPEQLPTEPKKEGDGATALDAQTAVQADQSGVSTSPRPHAEPRHAINDGKATTYANYAASNRMYAALLQRTVTLSRSDPSLKLGLGFASENGKHVVNALVTGAVAHTSGIQIGQEILSINDQSTDGVDHQGVKDMLNTVSDAVAPVLQ